MHYKQLIFVIITLIIYLSIKPLSISKICYFCDPIIYEYKMREIQFREAVAEAMSEEMRRMSIFI